MERRGCGASPGGALGPSYHVIDGPYSPRWNADPTRVIEGLILHDAGVDSPYADVLARAMLNSGNSYHEVIGPSKRYAGRFEAHVLVPHHLVAWHADARLIPDSTPWAATERNNESTVGLCVTHPVTPEVLDVLTQRVVDLAGRYRIPPERVYGHRQVARSRTDPRGVDIGRVRAALA